MKNLTLAQITNELSHLNLRLGGKWRPKLNKNQNLDKSAAKNKPRLAIIVPYRNRETNLHIFLLFMHQFLSKQNVHYGIYLVEPLKDLKFNRAMLINIGFAESSKEIKENWNCFIFHGLYFLK